MFRSMGNMILARRDSGIGCLQISQVYRHDLRGAATPEACLSLAQKFVSRAGMSAPFDATQIADGGSMFGGFSYLIGKDFGRVWYRLAHEELVLGAYGCSREKQQASEITECESIMMSAHYAESDA